MVLTQPQQSINIKNLAEWGSFVFISTHCVASKDRRHVAMETAKGHFTASLIFIFKSPKHLRCKCNVL